MVRKPLQELRERGQLGGPRPVTLKINMPDRSRPKVLQTALCYSARRENLPATHIGPNPSGLNTQHSTAAARLDHLV
jgi:hypothetical protein